MKYTIEKEEKYTVLKLGEDKLDASIASSLKSEFVTLHAEGIRNVILDLSQVNYTDSSGLSAILTGNRAFREDGGLMILVSVPEHTMKLIRISQLEKVLNILPTVEEAVDAVFMHEIEGELKSENDA